MNSGARRHARLIAMMNSRTLASGVLIGAGVALVIHGLSTLVVALVIAATAAAAAGINYISMMAIVPRGEGSDEPATPADHRVEKLD